MRPSPASWKTTTSSNHPSRNERARSTVEINRPRVQDVLVVAQSLEELGADLTIDGHGGQRQATLGLPRLDVLGDVQAVRRQEGPYPPDDAGDVIVPEYDQAPFRFDAQLVPVDLDDPRMMLFAQ